ncbi:MAG: hypothetical protein GVY34_10250 [Alphaproteobacteria bacterium]|jgi:hypothetical protein|nr:hypothetical protein [Alphaproteobacteria bacterium]
MIVPHILVGMACGIVGMLFAVGGDGPGLRWVASYSLAGSIGLVLSLSFVVLRDLRGRRLKRST